MGRQKEKVKASFNLGSYFLPTPPIPFTSFNFSVSFTLGSFCESHEKRERMSGKGEDCWELLVWEDWARLIACFV